MKTKNLLKYLMAATIIGIVFTACKKKEAAPAPAVVVAPSNDTKDASDNSFAESTFNDVGNIADQGAAGGLSSYLAANNNSQEKGILSTCAQVNIDTLSGSNHTIVIFFGNIPCLCGDGRYRSGTITAHFQGHFHDVGSTITITYSNYSVNGNLVDAVHSIVNNGPNIYQHPVYTIDVNGTIVKAHSGGTIVWVAHRTREWTDGYNTTTGIGHCIDDVFSINGYAHGTYSSNNTFTDTCINLKVHLNCDFIESGKLNLTPTIGGIKQPTRYIDFGPLPDACDNQASVTVNGTVYNFTLL